MSAPGSKLWSRDEVRRIVRGALEIYNATRSALKKGEAEATLTTLGEIDAALEHDAVTASDDPRYVGDYELLHIVVQGERARLECALVGRHFKDAVGVCYRITGVTADKMTGELRVDYLAVWGGHRWSQSLESFRREMTPVSYLDFFIGDDL